MTLVNRSANERFLASLECVKDGKSIATGRLRMTCEAYFDVSPEASKADRIDALSQLIGAGSIECVRHGLTDMHAFLTGDQHQSLSRLLQRKYGFLTHEHEVLVLKIGV
jgi:hypothetical protein